MNTNITTDQFSCNVCELNFKTEQHYAIHCKGHLHAERLAASLKALNKISNKSTPVEATIPVQSPHKQVVPPETNLNLSKQITGYAHQSQDIYGNWKSNTSSYMAQSTATFTQAIPSTSYGYSTTVNNSTYTQQSSVADYYGFNPGYSYPNNQENNQLDPSANPYYYSQSYPTSSNNAFVPTPPVSSFSYYGYGSEYYPTTSQNYVPTSNSVDPYNYAYGTQSYGTAETTVTASTQSYYPGIYDQEQVNIQAPFSANQPNYSQGYEQYNYSNTPAGFSQTTNYEQFKPTQHPNLSSTSVPDPTREYNWQGDRDNYTSIYQSSWQQYNANYQMPSTLSIQSKNFNQANTMDNTNGIQAQQTNWNYHSSVPSTNVQSVDQYKLNYPTSQPEYGRESGATQNYGVPFTPNLPWSQQSNTNIYPSSQYGGISSSTGNETNINMQNFNWNKSNVTNFPNALKEDGNFNGSQPIQNPWSQSNIEDPWKHLKPDSIKGPMEREANIDWRPLTNKNQSASDPPNLNNQYGQSFKNTPNYTMPTVQAPYGNINNPEIQKEQHVAAISNSNDYNKIGYSYENKPLNYNSRYSENIIPNESHSRRENRIDNSGRSRELDNNKFQNFFNENSELKQNIVYSSMKLNDNYDNKRKDNDKQFLEDRNKNYKSSKFDINQSDFEKPYANYSNNQNQNQSLRSSNFSSSKIIPLLSIKTNFPMAHKQTGLSQKNTSNMNEPSKFKTNEYSDKNWNNEADDSHQQNRHNLQNKNNNEDIKKSFSFNNLSGLQNKTYEERNNPFHSFSDNKINLAGDNFNKNNKNTNFNQSNRNLNNQLERRKNYDNENFQMNEYDNMKNSPRTNEKLSTTLQMISKFNVKTTLDNSFKQPNRVNTVASGQMPRNQFSFENSFQTNSTKNTNTNLGQRMNTPTNMNIKSNNQSILTQRGNIDSKANMFNNQNFASEIKISRSQLTSQKHDFKAQFADNGVSGSQFLDRVQGNALNTNSSQMQREYSNSNNRFSSISIDSNPKSSITNISSNSSIVSTPHKLPAGSNININRNNMDTIRPMMHPSSAASLRPTISNISSNSQVKNTSIRLIATPINSHIKSSMTSIVNSKVTPLLNSIRHTMSGNKSNITLSGSTTSISSPVTVSNRSTDFGVTSQNQRLINSSGIRTPVSSNITSINSRINPQSSLRFNTPNSVTLVLIKPNNIAKSTPTASSSTIKSSNNIISNTNQGKNIVSPIVNKSLVRPLMSPNKILVSTSANLLKSNLTGNTNVSSVNLNTTITKSSTIRPIVSSLGPQNKSTASTFLLNNSSKVTNCVTVNAATSTNNISGTNISDAKGTSLTNQKPIVVNSSNIIISPPMNKGLKLGDTTKTNTGLIACSKPNIDIIKKNDDENIIAAKNTSNNKDDSTTNASYEKASTDSASTIIPGIKLIASLASSSQPSSESSVKTLTSGIAQSALLVSSNLLSQQSKDVPTQDESKIKNLISGKVDTTSTVSIVSPNVRNVTPVMQKFAPTIRNGNPIVRSVTPTIRSVTPIRSGTSVMRNVTPTLRSVTPATRSLTPTVRTATPVVRSVTPTVGGIASSVRTSTPTMMVNSLMVKNVTSSVRNVSPTVKNTTPSVDNVTSSAQSVNSSVSSNLTLTNSISGTNKRKLDDISLDKVKTMSVEDTAELFCESISSILEQIIEADKKMNCAVTENNKIMASCKAAERNAISSIKRILSLRNTVKAREILQIMQPIDGSILKKLVESKDDAIIKKMKMAGFDIKKMTDIIGAIENMKKLASSSTISNSEAPMPQSSKTSLLRTPMSQKPTSASLHRSNYEHARGIKRPADSRSSGYSEPPKRAMFQQQRFHPPQGSRSQFPSNNRPQFGRYSGQRGGRW